MEINPRLLKSEPMRRCRLHNCQGACCLYGVWVGVHEVERIRENAALIARSLPPDRRDPDAWLDGRGAADEFVPGGRVVHSAVLESPAHYGGTACVFLRRDHKCALQVAAEAAGCHPWYFKPFYCVLHPLDLDEEGRITLDRTELLLDEPGSCLRPAAQPQPLLVTFEAELKYLLGEARFAELLQSIRNEK